MSNNNVISLPPFSAIAKFLLEESNIAVFIFISLRSFKMKNVIPYYFLFFIEVVVHQILADYYLGGDAEFHYFILLIVLLPALSFGKRIKLASVVVTVSVILFLVYNPIIHIHTLPIPKVFLKNPPTFTSLR